MTEVEYISDNRAIIRVDMLLEAIKVDTQVSYNLEVVCADRDKVVITYTDEKARDNMFEKIRFKCYQGNISCG